ncbi:hypothetical protein EVAR_49760_1 [Eumeta japonica]|uniref:Uncharacterized protein n=1 Tax=Eumeta variegata TaxID=151549 RepID=A0A4C1YBX9_EUMVA|nr:hypothetical protein EVAR_49760_1 [Eumeta japonica]
MRFHCVITAVRRTITLIANRHSVSRSYPQIAAIHSPQIGYSSSHKQNYKEVVGIPITALEDERRHERTHIPNYRRVNPYLGFLSQPPRRTNFLRYVGKMMDNVFRKSYFFITAKLHMWWSEYNCDGCMFFFVVFPVRKRAKEEKNHYGPSVCLDTQICPTLTD